jgi:hypothetical protein
LPGWHCIRSEATVSRRGGFAKRPANREPIAAANNSGSRGNLMRKLLLTLGFLALAVGLLWIGQGTGAIKWPEQSFMINQIQWAGYGMALSALGLILIWQGKS